MDKDLHIQGKRVLLFGLGLHGGGASVVRFLHSQKARIRVTDLKTRTQLRAILTKLPPVRGTFGQHLVSDIEWADVIVKNPGIDSSNPFIKKAKELGKDIVSDVQLFYSCIEKVPECAVTGTRGKTTTTELIGHIARKAYSNVFVGGNNRVHLLDNWRKAKSATNILELSSFQAEDSIGSKISPHVGVFTNFFTDHLNRYRTIQKYFAAKASLFLYQKKNDFAVLNYDDPRVASLKRKLRSHTMFFSLKKFPISLDGAYISKGWIYLQMNKQSKRIFALSKLRISGTHNIQNALAAIVAASALRMTVSHIRLGLKTFQGVAYRQEYKATKKGRVFINDTTATSPDALIAAYHTVRRKYPKHTLRFIVGGSDKKLDFSVLQQLPKDSLVSVYLLAGSATKKLRAMLPWKAEQKKDFSSLKTCLQTVWKESHPQDVIILSPGAASFGMFNHEFDRGDQFNSLIATLT